MNIAEEYRDLFCSDGMDWEEQERLFESLSRKDRDLLSYYTRDFQDIESRYMKFWQKFRDWMIWYPDLFYELMADITDVSFSFDTDQKMVMREMSRRSETTLICNRRYGKSFLAIAVEVVKLIAIPNRKSVYSAQSKDKSGEILAAKMNELVNFFPFLKEGNGEVKKFNYATNDTKIEFENGSSIIATHTEGARGSTISGALIVDEWCFRDLNELDDAMKAARTTRINLKTGKHDPFDINNVINISSAGMHDSRAHKYYKKSFKRYAEGGNNFVVTANYELSLYFNRALTEEMVKEQKETSLPMFFNMNYDSIFGGNDGNGVIPLHLIETARKLKKTEFSRVEDDGHYEYFISADLARSEDGKGDRTIAIVGKAYMDNKGIPYKLDIPAIIGIPKDLQAEEQVLKLKKLDEIFRPHNQIWDANIMGELFVDAARKVQHDDDGNVYPAFKEINPKKEREMDTNNYIEHLYRVKTSGSDNSQTDILNELQLAFYKKKVKLLASAQHDYNPVKDKRDFLTRRASHYYTDLFVNECLTHEINTLVSGKRQIRKKVEGRKYTKDVLMALAYMIHFVFKVYPEMYVDIDTEDEIDAYCGLYN